MWVVGMQCGCRVCSGDGGPVVGMLSGKEVDGHESRGGGHAVGGVSSVQWGGCQVCRGGGVSSVQWGR